MFQSMRIVLYPTAKQEKIFSMYAEAYRITYNACLSERISRGGSQFGVFDTMMYAKSLKHQPGYVLLERVSKSVLLGAGRDVGMASNPRYLRRGKCRKEFGLDDGCRFLGTYGVKIPGLKHPVLIKESWLPTEAHEARVVKDGPDWYLSFDYKYYGYRPRQ